MIRKLVLLLLGFLLWRASAQSKTLLHYEQVALITTSSFDSIRHAMHVPKRLAPVQYDVKVYEVDYTTTWWDGTPIKASGLILLPQSNGTPTPLVAYGHGTRLHKERLWKMSGEEAVCAFFAADGYAIAMPDYIGLGRGERNHLYHHAATEATCMVDMLYALKELQATLGFRDNGQLFITGYSQGGHVAMATHKYLQVHPELGMKVTASAPMSGAYDLSGVQSEVLYHAYEYPGYLPYLLFSFQAAYHILPDSAAYLKAPYDSLLLPYYDGLHRLREINKVMPSVPADVLKPELLAMYHDDPQNPLRLAMEENSLIHWAPEAPMLMCYCKADEQVIYRNALVARDTMESLGSTVVHTRRAGVRMGHGPCALYACMYAKMWFDSFRAGSTEGKSGPAWNRFLLSMSKLVYKKPKKKAPKHKP